MSSLKKLIEIVSRKRPTRSQRPSYESLESRQVLTAQIASLDLVINDQAVLLTELNRPLQLEAEDVVEVRSINFASTPTSGVLAAEGYVNKLADNYSPSQIDYQDSRFSLREANFEADGSAGSIEGLNSGWQVQSGWDRLTINIVHYEVDSITIADRLILRLQVGTPDFAFDMGVVEEHFSSETIRAGSEVEIPVHWGNIGTGVFHNYAEVDIYHSSDLDTIVWAGASVGNVGDGFELTNVVRNTRADDAFSELWTPDQTGEYVLKYYLDPEAVNYEAAEWNNETEYRVFVRDANTDPEANEDFFTAFSGQDLLRQDVLANDVDRDNDELSVVDFSQPENGFVNFNSDGTFNFKSNHGFIGSDEFSYTVTDGFSESKTTVQLEVTLPGFEVVSSASGLEDTPIDLQVSIHPDLVQAVVVSGLPQNAFLNQGFALEGDTYLVPANEVEGLQVIPPANSDADFVLDVTPVVNGDVLDDLSMPIDVTVDPVVDGGEVEISDTYTWRGVISDLDVNVNFVDQDGSESHVIRFVDLDNSFHFNVGERVGNDWVINHDDLDDLKLYLSSNGRSSWYWNYERFDLNYVVESSEADSNESVESYFGSFKVVVYG